MKKSAALHSTGSPDWQTPPAFIEAARQVMGGIDLDPASDVEANAFVKAKRFFTVKDDGLSRRWSGRVFLNPPGGLVPEFWRKLIAEYVRSAKLEQAIWIGYSLEQLQTLQRADGITPLHFPFCVPSKRIAFVENAAMKDARIDREIAAGKRPKQSAGSPTHSNYICYLGRRRQRFAKVFSAFGIVVEGAQI